METKAQTERPLQQLTPLASGSNPTQPTLDPAPEHLPAVEPTNETEQCKMATETLLQLLEENGGIVSSKTLIPELEKRVIKAREMNTKLKLFNFDEPEPELPRPNFRYFHRGRSFYSEEAFREAENATEAGAEAAERQVQVEQAPEDEQDETRAVKKKNRQEEARLGKYVAEALESLYASAECGPEAPIAFDIHNERPGTEFENVDVLAVHWRTDEIVELVAVEVKLQFSPKVVLQAGNYKRFAHRVWIAVPVSSDDPAIELRETDPLLFEHVVEHAIGILACRKRPGGSYQVWPIHWPGLNRLDSVARDAFIERYRPSFEEALVVEQKQQTWRPKIR